MVIALPRNFNFLPAERAEARSLSRETGKLRRSITRSISTPTAPDAKAQGRTTTLTPLVAFSTSAKGLAGTDASVATTTLRDAQRTQLPLGIAASVAAVLALFSAVWGLSRRLAEYV